MQSFYNRIGFALELIHIKNIHAAHSTGIEPLPLDKFVSCLDENDIADKYRARRVE